MSDSLQSTQAGPGSDSGSGLAIGPYRLLEKIGEGGFGEVWLAEQKEPVKRRVALKVIKLGMDTKQVVARFEAERQALALMDHPNIAKVFDAGATDLGRPYFVMEHVKGVSITDYCATHKLSTTERLHLFIQVCRAIQHAHQKGIIHRDIKPSNILVSMQDGQPVPKVIDFGIAKATQMELTEKTIHTQLNQFIGTPAYMSPEQAEMTGLDIDTRSDIYSLGVLLYELLTGSTPFDTKELLSAGLDQMRRIIREREPLRPSTRLSQLMVADGRRLASARSQIEIHKSKIDPDLDWIILKCLEKDRTRRYESASGLAADLQRHLANEPVTARPPSTGYRLGKAWRRNRLAFSAALALVSALIIGTIGTSFGLFRAERERAKSVRSAREAEVARRAAETKALELETNAYFNLVALAHQQITTEPSNIREAEALLAEAPSRLRDWEWHYLKRRRFADPFSFRPLDRHQIHGLAFSPDEHHLALAGGDGTVRVCSVLTGQLETSLAGHNGYVDAVTFHPRNPSLIASAGSDSLVKLWDWKNRQELNSWPGAPALDYGLAYSVCFSPDGRLLAAPLQKDFVVRELPEGTELFRLPGHEVRGRSVAFSPDGKRLATTSDGGLLRIWDAPTGRLIGRPLGTPGAPLTSVAFSRDGSRIAATRIIGLLHLWHVETGAELGAYPMGTPPLVGLAANSASDRLAAGGFDRMATIFDLNTGRRSIVLRELGNACTSLAFSPTGHFLAASGREGTVTIWDAAPLRGNEDQSIQTIHYPSAERPGQIWAMASSPTGTELSFGGRSLTIPDGGKGAPLYRWNSRSTTIATNLGYDNVIFTIEYHPTLPWIAVSADDREEAAEARVWDLDTASQPFAMEKFENEEIIFSTLFSRDGRWLVGAGRDRQIRVWDGTTGRKVVILGEHRREIVKLAFSPDGRKLASLGNDDRVKLWDATRLDQQQAEQREFPARSTGFADSIAFAPDSAWLAIISDSDHAMIYHLHQERDPVRLVSRAHRPVSLAFSLDGLWIATGGADGAIEIWNARTGVLRQALKAHTDRVMRIQFARFPDGPRLVSASHDGTVKIWNVEFLAPR